MVRAVKFGFLNWKCMGGFNRQAAGLKSNKSSLGTEEADKGNLSEWGGVEPL